MVTNGNGALVGVGGYAKIPKPAAVFFPPPSNQTHNISLRCRCLNRSTQTRHDVGCVSERSHDGDPPHTCVDGRAAPGWPWGLLNPLRLCKQQSEHLPKVLQIYIKEWHGGGDGSQLHIPDRAAVTCLHTHVTSVSLCQGNNCG